jgi:hypothetical protein
VLLVQLAVVVKDINDATLFSDEMSPRRPLLTLSLSRVNFRPTLLQEKELLLLLRRLNVRNEYTRSVSSTRKRREWNMCRGDSISNSSRCRSSRDWMKAELGQLPHRDDDTTAAAGAAMESARSLRPTVYGNLFILFSQGLVHFPL